MKPFVTFVLSVAFFHVSEFVLASVYMRKDLSRRCKFCVMSGTTCGRFSLLYPYGLWITCASRLAAWLISEPYCVAMMLACLEYWLEIRYCSIFKFKVVGRKHTEVDITRVAAGLVHPELLGKGALQMISRAGLAGIVTGEVIRKTAMVG